MLNYIRPQTVYRASPIMTRLLHAKPVRPWNTHRLTPVREAPAAPTKSETDASKSSGTSDLSTHKTETAAKVDSPKKPVSTTAAAPKRRRPLRPLKAAITLTPKAVTHLRALLDSPDPKLIRVGVRNRGCSGLTYNLEYVEKPGKFDETITQDGVTVLIDSKALFSVIGSQMDWVDDKLSSRFVFNNPNSKGSCGCGESFMV